MGSRGSRTRRHGWTTALLALGLGACTQGEWTPSSPPARLHGPDAPPTADYHLSGTPCGEVVVDHTGTVDQAPVDCLLAAVVAGQPAHLVAGATTVEGDLVFYAYQVTGKNELAVALDARWDNFGSRQLTRLHCTLAAAGGLELRGSEGRSVATADCRAIG